MKRVETSRSPISAGQIALDFDPGLREQFPRFMDCVRASVYRCGRPFKAIAADLNMSSSELSRRLSENPSDPIPFHLEDLPALMRSTGSTLPAQWLVLEFLNDPDAARRAAEAELAQLLPKISALLDRAKART